MSDDLIRRGDVIRVLHDEWDECLVVDESGQYIADICEEVINTVPSADSSQGEWISCSERYPDMDERVLVYTVAHEYHVWDCMSNRSDNYFWEDEEGLYRNKYEADMWMPLP